jgi:hypothetical protein
MLRRDAVARSGGFDERFRGIHQMCEDQSLLVKIYLREVVLVADECWDRHRQHPRSFCETVTRTGRYPEVRRHFLRWLEDYLGEEGMSDDRIWTALRSAQDAPVVA